MPSIICLYFLVTTTFFFSKMSWLLEPLLSQVSKEIILFGIQQPSMSMQMLKRSFLFFFPYPSYTILVWGLFMKILCMHAWLEFVLFINYLIELLQGALLVITEKARNTWGFFISGQHSWIPPNTESVSTEKQNILGYFQTWNSYQVYFKQTKFAFFKQCLNKGCKVFKQML